MVKNVTLVFFINVISEQTPGFPMILIISVFNRGKDRGAILTRASCIWDIILGLPVIIIFGFVIHTLKPIFRLSYSTIPKGNKTKSIQYCQHLLLTTFCRYLEVTPTLLNNIWQCFYVYITTTGSINFACKQASHSQCQLH